MVLAKTMTHLPVIADPSHATGRRDLVPALSRAALAAGADGLIVEVHPHPERALFGWGAVAGYPEFRSDDAGFTCTGWLKANFQRSRWLSLCISL
jgi:hypothetical protein